MAKVLLIQPHRNLDDYSNRKYCPPTSLIYLGTAIKDKHSVIIYDRNNERDDEVFFKKLEEYNPDIIGFTSMTSTMLKDIIYLGKKIKEKYPKKIIIVGGVHATAEPKSVLNELYVDYILRGEGEEAFLEFCNTFDKNKSKLGKIKNINLNPMRPFIDMNKLELPDFSLVDVSKYDFFYILTSRGCPGRCTFCYNIQMWGKNGNPCVRFYNTEKTKQLFKYIIEDVGIKTFTIADENFITFKKRCIEVCDFLEKNYKGKINFFVFSRADFIDEETILALKRAGCHTVEFGLESGSKRILDLLNKNISIETQGNAITLCRKNGMFVDGAIMIGLPTETMEDLEMTRKFILKYKPDIPNFRIYNVLPASKIFDDLVASKKLKRPKTLEDWVNWQKDFGTSQHNFSEIPSEVLEEFCRKGHKIFYYRTKIKKLIFWLKRGEIKYTFKHIIKLLKIKLKSYF